MRTSSSSPSSSRRSAAQWAVLVEQSQKTHLSLKEFCVQKELPLHGLYFWRSKLNVAKKMPMRGFTPVRLRPSQRARSTNEMPAIEISLNNGRTVRVRGQVDLQELRVVLDAAEAHAAC